MNKNEFSPYIRVAMHSDIKAPFKINKRVLFDYEIILVTSGRCKITVNNKAYLCKKNDVVFLRPGILHEFESVESFDFSQPHIHFDVSYDGKSEKRFVSFKSAEDMAEHERAMIQPDVFGSLIPFVFTPFDRENFQRIFFEIIELYQKQAYNYELLCKAKMLELLDCILTQFDSGHITKTDTMAELVIAVKNYIDNNFLSAITLDDLSKQFYINKYTLLRKFKNMYHQSLMAYYRKKRLAYIENALKTTNLSVTALSQKLHFTDIYSFSRFFKMHKGCSPTEYRKKHFSD
ncbi:MAG: helix-turn-helix transcriptional regulator [Clostridia bacterium]|nr:helix-turn-helix transcriptional regulator [Clostridia bacterium]